jgi:hypothetical protein
LCRATRFPKSHINDAFTHLRLLNFVMHGNSGKSFRLSNDFNSLTKVLPISWNTTFNSAHKTPDGLWKMIS